ncbi:TonB-dependent receptor plug domain-containing protein [Colwelliaceae bacterium 6441]
MHKAVAIFGLLFIAFSSSSEKYSSPDQYDLFELSIEELMRVRISLATKTEETVKTVPSTITIFNQTDIQALGVKNAYDIMNYVPGFQMTRGDWVGAVPKEHARGIYLDNGYILVMINGQRLNEASFGKASVYTPHIPTEVVERIEVIRGPGSAIYGSNAFLGVINIITKKASQQLYASVGENGYQQLSTSWHHQFSTNTKLYGNASYEQSDGQHYNVHNNESVRDPLNSAFFELNLTHKKNALNFRYSENQLDEFLNIGGFSAENIHRSNSLSMMAKSVFIDNKNHQLEGKVSYSLFEIKSAGIAIEKESGLINEDFLVGPFWRTQSSDINIDHNWKINKALSLQSGLEYRLTKQIQAGSTSTHYSDEQQLIILDDAFYLGKLKTFKNIPEYKNLRKNQDMSGIYSQLKWQLKEDLTLFFGGRFDNVKGIEKKVSPRGAIVWQADSNHSLKLQYGESFRTPVNNELYSSDSVTTGNPNLTTEFVKTSELVWLYQSDNLNTEFVLFNNDLNDFINKVPYQGGALFTFENEIDKTINGFEGHFNLKISEPLRVAINYSQLFNDPINQSFKKFATLSLSYKQSHWRFNLNTIWRDSVYFSQNNGVDFYQKQYLITNATIKYTLSKKHSVSLVANNVFNKEYDVFDPRVYDGKVPGKGRDISFSYSYNF